MLLVAHRRLSMSECPYQRQSFPAGRSFWTASTDDRFITGDGLALGHIIRGCVYTIFMTEEKDIELTIKRIDSIVECVLKRHQAGCEMSRLVAKARKQASLGEPVK